jgi:probable rRNA maturation factor
MRPDADAGEAGVEVVVEDERWGAIEDLARNACAAALTHLGHDPARHVIVVLGADDTRIAALNGQFRERPAPTNVLSWPSAERAAAGPGGRPAPPEPGELGDIALAYETCHAEARANERPFADHVTHLLVHATLHLLGYRHDADPDAALMEATEIAILADLGLPNPYA